MFLKIPVKHQQGSMLVTALFVIIVLGMLGLAIFKIQSNSSRSIGYEVYGARAFNAANSGAERALAQIFPLNGTGSCSAFSFDLNEQVAFHGCRVEVECKPFSISETGFTHFRITSTATCETGDFTTQRKVAVEARSR